MGADRMAVLATLATLAGAAVCLMPSSMPAPVTAAPASRPAEGVRAVIADAAAARDDDVPALRRDALGDNPLRAAHAIRALARLGRLTTDEAVLGRLRVGPTRVRQELLLALGGSGDRSQISRLITCVHDPDPHVRRLALVALGRLDARAVLANVLADPDTDPVDRTFAHAGLHPPSHPALLASTNAAAR